MEFPFCRPSSRIQSIPFDYITNAGSITITGYTGPGGRVLVPSTINGLPVTSIASNAFENVYSLTSTHIPGSVTSVGNLAFYNCRNLTSVTISGSATSIVGDLFVYCYALRGVYFTGNAPIAGSSFFYFSDPTVYCLPGTTGWDEFTTNTGLTPVLWNPAIQADGGSFGVQSNYFGFNITGTNNFTVVVEVCTNLARPVWVPLATNTLANGVFHFSEPFEANSSGRFYGLGMP